MNLISSLITRGLLEHYTEATPCDPQPPHNVHSQANGRSPQKEETPAHGLSAVSQPAPLRACKPNTLHEGAARTTAIFPQQKMHTGTWLTLKVDTH